MKEINIKDLKESLHKKGYNISHLCDEMDIKTSDFYNWLNPEATGARIIPENKAKQIEDYLNSKGYSQFIFKQLIKLNRNL